MVGRCVVGWRLDKTKSILITTQVEVTVKAGLEKVLKINFEVEDKLGNIYFHEWVAGWLDQVGIRLSHLLTLKLKMSLAKIWQPF